MMINTSHVGFFFFNCAISHFFEEKKCKTKTQEKCVPFSILCIIYPPRKQNNIYKNKRGDV